MSNGKNVVVYCSSQDNLPPECENMAKSVGQWIGEKGHTLVYGGVDAGLMHIVAKATHEKGGRIVGVIPEVFKHRADELNDELILTANLNERKGVMIERGDVFFVLPGGIGTIDEWISTISHKKVCGDNSANIVVINIEGAYDAQIKQLQDTMSSPYASGDLMRWMKVVKNIDELKDLLNKN